MSSDLPGGWRIARLGDVLTLKRGYDLPASKRRPGHVPIVSSSGVSDVHDTAKVSGPGVVTGRYGTIGQVFYIEEDFWPLNTALYVEDFKGNEPRYCAELLKTINYRAYDGKSGVPGINRNDLHEAFVPLAPYDEQRRIAYVLASLDAKIESNRRIEGLCAAAISALFDEHCVRRAGRDWAQRSLADIAAFVNGKNFTKGATGSGRPVLRIKELNSGLSGSTVWNDVAAAPDNVASHYDLLFAWSGTLGVHRWDGPEALINQHIFKVISASYPTWWVEGWLRRHLDRFQRIAKDKAVTMGHIRRGDLDEAEVLVPSDSVLARLDAVVAPLDQLRASTAREAGVLTALRDQLLPKLVSGEVRVPAVAEDLIDAAAQPGDLLESPA